LENLIEELTVLRANADDRFDPLDRPKCLQNRRQFDRLRPRSKEEKNLQRS
jgi:hypothetical protein